MPQHLRGGHVSGHAVQYLREYVPGYVRQYLCEYVRQYLR
jgi:hypothetical protein